MSQLPTVYKVKNYLLYLRIVYYNLLSFIDFVTSPQAHVQVRTSLSYWNGLFIFGSINIFVNGL